mmetsp:Transcript_39081/g.124411  ORF Transcript_39081/g.124411 Transcript_39081/m.124411 type:complete len:225 (-) Transcript_39081:1489-2163(-)
MPSCSRARPPTASPPPTPWPPWLASRAARSSASTTARPRTSSGTSPPSPWAPSRPSCPLRRRTWWMPSPAWWWCSPRAERPRGWWPSTAPPCPCSWSPRARCSRALWRGLTASTPWCWTRLRSRLMRSRGLLTRRWSMPWPRGCACQARRSSCCSPQRTLPRTSAARAWWGRSARCTSASPPGSSTKTRSACWRWAPRTRESPPRPSPCAPPRSPSRTSSKTTR